MRSTTLLAAIVSCLPSVSHACAVCFSQTDNPNTARAFIWGLVILAGAVFFLLTGLGLVVWRIEHARRGQARS